MWDAGPADAQAAAPPGFMCAARRPGQPVIDLKRNLWYHLYLGHLVPETLIFANV